MNYFLNIYKIYNKTKSSSHLFLNGRKFRKKIMPIQRNLYHHKVINFIYLLNKFLRSSIRWDISIKKSCVETKYIKKKKHFQFSIKVENTDCFRVDSKEIIVFSSLKLRVFNTQLLITLQSNIKQPGFDPINQTTITFMGFCRRWEPIGRNTAIHVPPKADIFTHARNVGVWPQVQFLCLQAEEKSRGQHSFNGIRLVYLYDCKGRKKVFLCALEFGQREAGCSYYCRESKELDMKPWL